MESGMEKFRSEISAVIKQANVIPFSRIFNWPVGKSIKIRCPFKELHSNHDRNKSARYYCDWNVIICFTHHKRWTPVDLFAEKLGKSKYEVAKLLINKYGVSTKDSLEYLDSKLNSKPRQSDREQLYEKLEDCFETPTVRNFINTQSRIDIEQNVDLFEDTEKTARNLSKYIEESVKNNLVNELEVCDAKRTVD